MATDPRRSGEPAKSKSPSPPLGRRRFLALGLAVAGSAIAADVQAITIQEIMRKARARRVKRITMYRLSGRGRRISRAAKIHNANLRFATALAADAHRAHPGDRSRIVKVNVSVNDYIRFFIKRRSRVVDLRQI